jgi:hypothetical protein
MKRVILIATGMGLILWAMSFVNEGRAALGLSPSVRI